MRNGSHDEFVFPIRRGLFSRNPGTKGPRGERALVVAITTASRLTITVKISFLFNRDEFAFQFVAGLLPLCHICRTLGS